MAAQRASRHLLRPLVLQPLRRAPVAAALARRWNSGTPAAAPATAPVAGEATKPAVVDDGKSDWYYVGWGGLFLFFFGCPLYLVYLLKEDEEMRIWMGEHAPAVVEAVQGLVDVDEARRDSSYCNVVRSLDEETLTITLPDGTVKSATLPATATASDAAAALGVEPFQVEVASCIPDPTPHYQVLSPTGMLRIGEDELAALESTLADLLEAQAAVLEEGDPASPSCTAPLVEQDMRHTRAAHLGAQIDKVRLQLEVGQAQLRAANRKWYHLW